MTLTLTVTALDYHRNGISGVGFYVALFDWQDGPTLRHMVASLFPSPDDKDGDAFRAFNGLCAVFDVSELAKGNIDFAWGNSWRGDHFEHQLRAAIKAHEVARDAQWQTKIAERERARQLSKVQQVEV